MSYISFDQVCKDYITGEVVVHAADQHIKIVEAVRPRQRKIIDLTAEYLPDRGLIGKRKERL